MKFSEDSSLSALSIQAYNNNWIQVNQQRLTQTFAITNEQLMVKGFPENINDLNSQHLLILIKTQPDIIILGAGKDLYTPTPDIYQTLIQNQIGFEIMQTPAACRTYNVLLSESRKVAALFFLSTH